MTTRRPSGGNTGAAGSNPLAELPNILSITSQLVSYAVPKIFFIGAQKREVRQAVEITVQTAAKIPARALSPVMWIGETPVVEMEVIGPNRYKFYAVEPAQLEQGAAIALAWPVGRSPGPSGAAAAANRLATRFRFQLDGPVVA